MKTIKNSLVVFALAAMLAVSCPAVENGFIGTIGNVSLVTYKVVDPPPSDQSWFLVQVRSADVHTVAFKVTVTCGSALTRDIVSVTHVIPVGPAFNLDYGPDWNRDIFKFPGVTDISLVTVEELAATSSSIF
jgi:hypothetical protein